MTYQMSVLVTGEDPSSEIFLYAVIKNWSDEWLLRLNIDKCKSVFHCIKHPTGWRCGVVVSGVRR